MAVLSPDFLNKLSRDLGLTVPTLKAVVEVESSGQPFLAVPALTPRGADVSGYPVVQFEGHVFWQQLTSLKQPSLRPATLLSASPENADIIYPRANTKYTLRPLPEWDQLLKARAISWAAANASASWGAFQVMGFNAGMTGFPSLDDFVEAMNSLEGQTMAFVGYLRAVPPTLKALRSGDWETFARLYNGPGYARGGYHKKLALAHARNL
jgi:hypothetical protein